ncbi:MAG: hypothetical protein HY909_28470 [Deltaproteobacteria bacterium]|nr:hypothetical protein [Deltaproteobacteria bacterium]
MGPSRFQALSVVSRSVLLLATASAACSDPAPQSPDARLYDAREVTIDPRPDATMDSSPTDSSLDVTVVPFDSPPPPADAGAPRPDGARPDAPPPTGCVEIAEAYAQAVREAQTCLGPGPGPGPAGCSTLLCETLCCTCEVYANVGTVAFSLAQSLRMRWAGTGCPGMLPCPGVRCGRPAMGACSAEGRCVTLRSPQDAGR